MSYVVTPLHRYFSEAHLAEVIVTMRRMGPPQIRAFRDPLTGAWLAREGTHRIRAAFLLGIEPVLIAVEWWRSRGALERARFAAMEYGYVFGSERGRS